MRWATGESTRLVAGAEPVERRAVAFQFLRFLSGRQGFPGEGCQVLADLEADLQRQRFEVGNGPGGQDDREIR